MTAMDFISAHPLVSVILAIILLFGFSIKISSRPEISSPERPPGDSPTLGPGWVRIGVSTGRRSLWIRHDFKGKIELASGPDGEFGYVVLTRKNPQWNELVIVLLHAQYAEQLNDVMDKDGEDLPVADADVVEVPDSAKASVS